jgi:hypothetical protein
LGTTDIEDWELSDSEEDNTEQADSFPNYSKLHPVVTEDALLAKVC